MSDDVLKGEVVVRRLKPCPSCGGVVSKAAGRCPHCDEPLKKPSGVGFWTIMFAAFVGAAVLPYIIHQLWRLLEFMSFV